MLPRDMTSVKLAVLCVCLCFRYVATAAFLDPPDCGISKASFTRVVGGASAKLGAFPWMAVLGYQNDEDINWHCGGSLISSRHVLTAAHCIHHHEKDLKLVRLGDLDLENDNDGAAPVDVPIKRKITHEQYNANVFACDIGLLILERDVDFTDLIKPICIPKKPHLVDNSFVDYNPYVAGWGYLSFPGLGFQIDYRFGKSRASHLQFVQLPVLDNSFCEKAYEKYEDLVLITDSVMCVGYKKGGKASCTGDSGGPLMHTDDNKESGNVYFYVIGIVSFSRNCAEPGFPTIYTRVSSYLPWLQKHMR